MKNRIHAMVYILGALVFGALTPANRPQAGPGGPDLQLRKAPPFKRAPIPAERLRLIEPVRVHVEATGPAHGPENAPVTIVEFGDFQCPFSKRLVPTLSQIREKYGDKVRIVFRQFPLDLHDNAAEAAEASLCAHDQGKFWEMHDAMFADQQGLGVENLKAKAAELGLNAEQFNDCMDQGKHAAAVQADIEAGTQAGVGGTPAIFINGRFVNGSVPLEQITPIIDDELRRFAAANSGNP